MKFEKIRCDGCLKEYDIGSSGITLQFFAEISIPDHTRVTSNLLIKSEGTTIKIPTDRTLDFCKTSCLDTYLNKFKEVPE